MKKGLLIAGGLAGIAAAIFAFFHTVTRLLPEYEEENNV